jgi:hypothetical protein
MADRRLSLSNVENTSRTCSAPPHNTPDCVIARDAVALVQSIAAASHVSALPLLSNACSREREDMSLLSMLHIQQHDRTPNMPSNMRKATPQRLHSSERAEHKEMVCQKSLLCSLQLEVCVEHCECHEPSVELMSTVCTCHLSQVAWHGAGRATKGITRNVSKS